MKIWSVDADDAGNLHEGLLHETPWIKSFLAPEGTSRFLLVATKGFGKTLLLRAKRMSLENSGIQLLPANALTDKPLGKVRIFSRDETKRLAKDKAFWENAWLMAITLAVVKAARRLAADGPIQLGAREFRELRPLFESETHTTVTDHFTEILTLSPQQYFRAVKELARWLAPAFRQIHTPIATFIDNVDEHFDIHLATPDDGDSSYGATNRRLWYAAQTGLAMAIRHVHVQNHHVKIYASVRSEAFAALVRDSPSAQQLEGSAVRIEYEPQDLREIFARNIDGEPPENTVEAEARDVFQKFLGRESLHMVHPHVGEPEPVWDYIRRHTLMRPRDFMTIGAALSGLSPGSRTPLNIRRAVNEASTTIVNSYLNEIRPHLSTPIDFKALFSLIPSNVLTKDDLAKIAREYTRTHHADVADGEVIHVFCALYKAGLLGYVTHEIGTTRLVQKFERPGEMLFATDHVLPESLYFIIHPALNGEIRRVSARFNSGFSTLNIAGHGRRWRDPRGGSGVLKGDVVGYSAIMAHPDLSRNFPTEFDRMVAEASENLAHHKIERGDAFELRDGNSINLIAAARSIAAALLNSAYAAQVRVGGDFGTKAAQAPFRTAARLEALGLPNTLIFTREFSDAAKAISADFSGHEVNGLAPFVGLRRHGNLIDIRKSEKDLETLRELFYITLVESTAAGDSLRPPAESPPPPPA